MKFDRKGYGTETTLDSEVTSELTTLFGLTLLSEAYTLRCDFIDLARDLGLDC